MNISQLSPEQLFEITKQPNFTEIFTQLSNDDKKLFISKIQQRKIKSNISIKKNITDEHGNAKSIEKKINPPSVTQMAKTFGNAMIDWGKSGFKMTPEEEYQKRMTICRSCEFWKEIPGPIVGRCMKCGCSGAKQKLATSSCPIGKWTTYSPTS